MAVAARFAADTALKAHEASLKHGGGELPELGLEAFPAVDVYTNVLNHTLDYTIRKETCQALLQGFLTVLPIPVQLDAGFDPIEKRSRR